MSNITDLEGYCQGVAYHDYAMLIAQFKKSDEFLSKESVENKPIDCLVSPMIFFEDNCEGYLNGLVKNAKKFKKEDQDYKIDFDSYLYNPVTFLSFGETDGLGMVVIDDFGIAVEITSNVKLSNKQTQIAFCPKIDTIGIDEEDLRFFAEPHELFMNRHDQNSYGLNVHPFFKSRPLVGYTAFRLNGLAKLGNGLLLQKATFKSIAKKVSETLNLVDWNTEFTRVEDIDTFKCLILDPVGWPDVIILMYSNNYSIIGTVINALQSLTINDISIALQDGPLCEEVLPCLDAYGVNNRIQEIDSLIKNKCSPNLEKICSEKPLFGNHALFSTVTNLGITSDAFFEDSDSGNDCTLGFTNANINFNVSAGHLDDFQNHILKTGIKKNELNSLDTLKKNQGWIQMGLYDGSISPAYDHPDIKILSLSSVIQKIKILLGFGSSVNILEWQWPLREITSILTLPIIKGPFYFDHSLKKDIINHPHVNLRPILTTLKEALFESQNGVISISILRGSIKQLRIPAPLSSGLAYLYSDFSKALSDPFLFANVIDLFEIFKALHKLISGDLIDELNQYLKEYEHDKRLKELKRLSFLDEIDIQELTSLVKLLSNALQHRTCLGVNDVQKWHIPFNFKGILNKLVTLSSVPMTCSLEIIRCIIANRFDAYNPNEKIDVSGISQTNVGGALRVSLNHRVEGKKIKVGHNQNDFIVDLSINIAQLTHPHTLYSHLSQTGYLIFQLFQGNPTAINFKKNTECIDKCKRTDCFWLCDEQEYNRENLEKLVRMEQIFAEMFAFSLVFGKDENIKDGIEAYTRYFMVMYTMDPMSMNRDDKITLWRLAEVLIRVFLTSDPFIQPQRYDNSGLLYDHMEFKKPSKEDIENAKKRFIEQAEMSGPLFYDFSRFWKNKNAKTFVLEHFTKVFEISFRQICCSFYLANNIVTDVNDLIKLPKDTSKHNVLNNYFAKSFDEGYPFAKYKKTYTDSENTVDKTELFYIVRQILNIHLKSHFSVFNNKKTNYYLRNQDNYSETNRFLVDKFESGFFSADPELRKLYLHRRILVMKSLWDVSTAIRATTLRGLFDNINWGKLKISLN